MSTNNAYTIAEIDSALSKVSKALSQLPDGAVNASTTQILLELYLGSLDNPKETEKAQAAKGAV